MQLHYRIARSPLTSCLQRSATQCAPPKCYPGSVIKQIEVICCRSRLEPLDADIHKGDKSEAIVDAVGGCTCNVIHVYFGCDCKAEKRVKMSGWVAEWLARLLNLHSGVILTCDGLLTDGCDAARNGRWRHCHLKCRMDSPNSTNKCCSCSMWRVLAVIWLNLSMHLWYGDETRYFGQHCNLDAAKNQTTFTWRLEEKNATTIDTEALMNEATLRHRKSLEALRVNRRDGVERRTVAAGGNNVAAWTAVTATPNAEVQLYSPSRSRSSPKRMQNTRELGSVYLLVVMVLFFHLMRCDMVAGADRRRTLVMEKKWLLLVALFSWHCQLHKVSFWLRIHGFTENFPCPAYHSLQRSKWSNEVMKNCKNKKKENMETLD